MRITYDPAKRAANREKHGLDFDEAAEVFAGPVQTETRFVTVGYLRGRLVVVVWTPRAVDERRIISMRKASDKEQAYFRERLGEG